MYVVEQVSDFSEGGGDLENMHGKEILWVVAGVLDEHNSQLTLLRGVAVHARQTTGCMEPLLEPCPSYVA
jgi:hypothetical protein